MPHFVIMGAGRVGVMLAHSLESAGHTVAIIDQDERAFRRLRKDFDGKKVKGVGFDRETLKRADIEHAYAFAAVSSGDNSNILASRVARETFKVAHVVARINDPNRAEFFQRLGVPTVAAVRWSTDQVLRRILPEQSMTGDYREASGRLVLAELQLHDEWTGHPLSDIEDAAELRIAFITRFGEGMLPTPDTSYQQGDVVHAMMRTQEMNTVARILSAPPADVDAEPLEPKLEQRSWGRPASTVERLNETDEDDAGESGLERGVGKE
ncbi:MULTISPECIES: potassium channel family protein [Micrococcales]|uniref:potassium channel family protein n=1 Tax=Micrococcales TaxID=85006 RepID=UPI0009E7C25F|nr:MULTISPECIES: TrkA family potassium uptake protein [Micrococcales]